MNHYVKEGTIHYMHVFNTATFWDNYGDKVDLEIELIITNDGYWYVGEIKIIDYFYEINEYQLTGLDIPTEILENIFYLEKYMGKAEFHGQREMLELEFFDC